MGKIALSVLALAALAAAFPTTASATVHDTLSSFDQIITNQPPPVAASRSILGNMFDGNLNTIYSLGQGGSIQFEVAPTTDVISSGSAVELTYSGGVDQEAARVYLGTNLGSYVYVGNLLNQKYPGGPGAVNADPSVATLSYSVSGDKTFYNLNVVSGTFNSFELVDMSLPTSSDGFDIAEFSLTTDGTSIPEPASMALLGAGLLGAAAIRRTSARK